MNCLKTLLAVAAIAALTTSADAGLFSKKNCEASKCCDCAPTFQPVCCKPKIVRPRCVNVYNYQRTCAKPFNCDSCVSDGCCMANACDTGNCCDTATACAPSGCCDSGCGLHGCAPTCAAPCASAACCDTGCCEATCAAPCDNGCCNNDVCCDSSAGVCCLDDSCCGDNCCDTVCCKDSCEIAELIHKSQTACYAVDRRRAIHKLGDRYDCVCNPEIMSAFIYALNDADERVRAKAADEIGDQLRKNNCCCNQCVVSALTRALADCDRKVRREAEQALRICGYDVVDACEVICCDTTCCDTTCAPGCSPVDQMVPAAPESPVPAAAEPQDAAPAPPAEGDAAYHPQPLPQASARPISSQSGLTKLFGFLR